MPNITLGRILMNTKRRQFIKAGVALGASLSAPALLAQRVESYIEADPAAVNNTASHRYNNSTFRTQSWQDHFDNTSGGAILVDIPAFALHFWNSDTNTYRQYPIAVPLKDEFARRGRTTVVRKVVGPEWRPTQSMLERDPDLPPYVGPGPDNPLGTHALYLGWEYYRIHGANDERKIGRRSSNGCIGLFNEQIAQLYDLVPVGCPVKMI